MSEVIEKMRFDIFDVVFLILVVDLKFIINSHDEISRLSEIACMMSLLIDIS